MANSLTYFNAEYWATQMQETFFKENVALGICNTELRDVLVDGTRVHRPYRGSMKAQTYTKGTDITTFNDLTSTDEYLDVDTVKVVPFYVDTLDKIQNKWSAIDIFASDSQKILNNLIDQAVLAEYSNAYSYISAQDLGGSGTGNATINTSNVMNLFTVAARQLDKYNRGQQDRFAIIGPRLREILRQSAAGRETGFGDTVGANGYLGNRFGFELYFSNNVPFSCAITTSSIPVDGETITVDGVVFTWEAHGTNCASAGEVDIGTSEDEAYANLVLAINGTTAGTSATYYDVSADDREQLNQGGITASYTAHALVISGYGDVVISEDTTNCAVTTNAQYPLFGVKKSIDFVIQKAPNVEFHQAEKRLGTYVFPWTCYGKKTFTKEKKGLVYAKVSTADWI